VPHAFISTEDRRFWGRPIALDLRAIVRAIIENHKCQCIAEGASTIPQQLAKYQYLDDSAPTYQRKLREASLALRLQFRRGKKQLLAEYLSTVYFGNGVYGLRAAARYYYGTTVDKLTLSQAIELAGAVKAPKRLGPTGNPKLISARALLVKKRMVDAGRNPWSRSAPNDGVRRHDPH
jgi:penicillin-binding protein 1A